MRRLHLFPLALLAACPSGPVPGDTEPGPCDEAEARLGERVCMHAVDAAAWTALSRPTSLIDQARTGKYMLPARPDARLPTLVMDVNAHELHLSFLRAAFPDQFGDLDPLAYEVMITDPARREFFAGPLTEYVAADGEHVFGFTIWDPQTDPASTVTCEQFRAAHAELARAFTAGPLAVVPSGELQRAALAGCDVPQYDAAAAIDYEAYTATVGFGTVRRYTPAELEQATARAAYGFQDILVLAEAPLDVERPISGAVTGTRQAELSHLNVRSAARGTPNCYVRDAHARLAAWEGQLVRLSCGKRDLEVEPATPEEAQAWWDALRPEPVEIPEPDLEAAALVGLLELPTATAEERSLGVRRHGAKGRNLAALYQRIPAHLQIPGFLVPFRYYDEFMRSQQWLVDLGDGPEPLSLADTVTRLLADPQFRADPALRRARLEALYEAIRDGSCDPALIEALEAELLEVFGAPDVMVRFRSSSNAEDGLRFNGAGLYESTSACLADDLDADSAGPSRCDPRESDERGVCRAMKKVWASLWLPRAFEEREWYGIDHAKAAMGILVDLRVGDEAANMVVFTGDPNLAGDRRLLVNAQLGELEVVSPDPGTWPEKTRLTLEGGEVTTIDRVRGSSELPEGEYVLGDAQLRELGAHMAAIEAAFPIDDAPPEGATVLLDTEWKVRADQTLMIKQVRPFLRGE